MSHTGNMSNEQYQARARHLLKRQEMQREEDLKALMAQPWGRRVAWWLIFDVGRLQAETFQMSGEMSAAKDGLCGALLTARNTGRQAVARELQENIRAASPGDWLKMYEEEIRTTAAELAARGKEPTSNDD